ncbi:MAG: hypothetical protein ACK5Q5_02345 [Planctomycetaceae bacterium]
MSVSAHLDSAAPTPVTPPSLLRQPELKVVALVVASLICSEIGMRCLSVRLSKDVAHLAQFDEIAAEINAQVPGDPIRVLFLGNSLTRYGVAAEPFEQAAAAAAGRPVHVVKMTPDNTALADWFYAYRNYFAEQGRTPDLLVIGFQGPHLLDAPSIHPQRLARFYCTADDWPDLRRDDLQGFEAQAAFVAASHSSLLADRDRIERRALDLLIPDYQAGIQTLNERIKLHASSSRSAVPTYHRLVRLLDLARKNGTQVVLAAMPVPTLYDIDPTLRVLAREHGAKLIDCRHVAGITDQMFPDGLHMNGEAAACYSQHLARSLTWNASPKHVAKTPSY